MKSQPLLRLDKSPATQRPPSADNVDLIFDAESGALKAIDADGDVPFAGASVTAASINAALEGESLEVDSFAPSDSSGVALPDGEVAWNETLGGWVRHDGTTIGGILLVPQDPWYSNGAKTIVGTTLATDQLTELVRFPLTSAQAVIGKRFRLSGSYGLIFPGTRPADCYVGLVPEDSEDLGVGVVYGADHSGNTLKVVKADITWEFTLGDNSGGQFFLEIDKHAGGEARLTGTTSSVALVDTAYTLGSEIGTAGQAQDLVFQIQTSAVASAGAALINWDLRLEQTL